MSYDYRECFKEPLKGCSNSGATTRKVVFLVASLKMGGILERE